MAPFTFSVDLVSGENVVFNFDFSCFMVKDAHPQCLPNICVALVSPPGHTVDKCDSI